MDEKFCLKWNEYPSNVIKSFNSLRHETELSDVTLVGDDHIQIFSHKVVLSSSSSYFREIFIKNKHSHPLLCLTGVDSKDINNILDYIYNGEVKIYQDNLDYFMVVSQRFKLEGLINYNKNGDEEEIKENYSEVEESFDAFYTPKDETIMRKQQSKCTNTYDTLLVSKTYSNMDEVKRRTWEMMKRGPDGIWMCTKCPKVSKIKTHVQDHAEIHLAGLSFQCPHCDKTYRSRHSLRTHTNICKYKLLK